MLVKGEGVPRDVGRATRLLTRASEDGSAIATYNLGVLALNGVAGGETQAFDHFTTAARLGEPLGYQAAALLLDQGLGRPRDPDAAADLLLKGVASDNGQAWSRIAGDPPQVSPDTIRAVQTRLATAGFYDGAIDGLPGPRLRASGGDGAQLPLHLVGGEHVLHDHRRRADDPGMASGPRGDDLELAGGEGEGAAVHDLPDAREQVLRGLGHDATHDDHRGVEQADAGGEDPADLAPGLADGGRGLEVALLGEGHDALAVDGLDAPGA